MNVISGAEVEVVVNSLLPEFKSFNNEYSIKFYLEKSTKPLLEYFDGNLGWLHVQIPGLTESGFVARFPTLQVIRKMSLQKSLEPGEFVVHLESLDQLKLILLFLKQYLN